MEWENLIGVITALIFVILLPLVMRARKKGGPQKREGLLEHLSSMGVKASLMEEDAGEMGAKSRFGGLRSEGIIKLEGKKIDYINVASQSSQYGVNYFLDFLVKKSDWSGEKNRKRTKMVKKRSSGLWGRVIDVEFRGDDYLSRELNFDYSLKDRLMQAEREKQKTSIWIYPEPKHEYARIRTSYLLFSSDLFEALDLIAGHIKTGW